ncbi:MAG: hypothetical protein CM1200mP2_00120 [Planctomycetaceae bacterium]|nr:MAG: hypothetical protein CM1200mP2_00120 [Planctomycetaceae bacterium]
MSFDLSGFYYRCFAEPALQPAGLVIAILAVYWSLVCSGGRPRVPRLELRDQPRRRQRALDFGLVPLRYLNLGTFPVMLWMTSSGSRPGCFRSDPLRLGSRSARGGGDCRGFGLATLATKLATNPFRSVFEIVEPHRPETLIGQTCTISTLTATDVSGEAHFSSEGAPLILSVRTSDGDLTKGQTAKIIEYNRSDNTYIVSGTIGGDE